MTGQNGTARPRDCERSGVFPVARARLASNVHVKTDEKQNTFSLRCVNIKILTNIRIFTAMKKLPFLSTILPWITIHVLGSLKPSASLLVKTRLTTALGWHLSPSRKWFALMKASPPAGILIDDNIVNMSRKDDMVMSGSESHAVLNDIGMNDKNHLLTVDKISRKAESSNGILCVIPRARMPNINNSPQYCASYLEQQTENLWNPFPGAQPADTTVHGYSLRTWSLVPNGPLQHSFHKVERVRLVLKTRGRPLKANIEVWQGPDKTPQKMTLYIENGSERPFITVIETTPKGDHAIAVQNTATMEFPLSATLEAEMQGQTRQGPHCDLNLLGDEAPRRNTLLGLSEYLYTRVSPTFLQGRGSVYTYSSGALVECVHLLMCTDGRPMHATIELLQGPNNIKQKMQVHHEDGADRPLFLIIQTPGNGSVLRVVNTAAMEFPLKVYVEPLYRVTGEALMTKGANTEELFYIS